MTDAARPKRVIFVACIDNTHEPPRTAVDQQYRTLILLPQAADDFAE
jgi:hypothetical protein